MAVNIDAFKSDLDALKNQRSVIQAKFDEANRHVNELMETLKGMGFNSIDEAKQAYAKQCQDAEKQHAQVQVLIDEIKSLDAKVPSREDVMARLASLSQGDFENTSSVPDNPVLDQVIASSLPEKPDADFGDGGDVSYVASAPIPEESVPTMEDVLIEPLIQQSQENAQLTNSSDQGINNGEPDLGQMLFASL